MSDLPGNDHVRCVYCTAENISDGDNHESSCPHYEPDTAAEKSRLRKTREAVGEATSFLAWLLRH